MSDFRKLMEFSRLFQVSKIFLTACELDIFSHLSPTPKGIAELSKELGISARSLEIFMGGLCATGTIEKKGDLFSNSPEAEEFLVKGRPNYRGEIFRHANFYWNEWSQLEKTLTAGRSRTASQQSWLNNDRERVNAFIRGMDNNARDFAPLVLKHLNLEEKRHMLDLGGGPGTYTITFLKEYPGLKATIFDLPMTLQIAEENIRGHGMQERISLQPGDFLKDSIGEGYDFVWMSHILHSNSEEECELLIKKVYDSLGKNGMVGIHDFILNPDKVSPSFAAVFGVHMLAVTEKGRTYTDKEITGWLQKVGFNEIEVIQVSEISKMIKGKK
jgi:cyclopropane fatty-acyl-phospholipid synthase-like methyltransferase